MGGLFRVLALIDVLVICGRIFEQGSLSEGGGLGESCGVFLNVIVQVFSTFLKGYNFCG